MPVRIVIAKQTAHGEQITADICQWNPVTGEIVHEYIEEMQQLADEVLKLTDIRVVDMNTRMLEAYNLEQYFDPAIWSRVVCILDILAGRQTADTVARRWQSEQEETAALAAERYQYNTSMLQAANTHNDEQH